MNNGVILRGNFDNGGTIEFSCNRGYKLIGSRVLRCVNGQWNDRFPECRKGNEKMKYVELANRLLGHPSKILFYGLTRDYCAVSTV